jgi:hypothetical protein
MPTTVPWTKGSGNIIAIASLIAITSASVRLSRSHISHQVSVAPVVRLQGASQRGASLEEKVSITETLSSFSMPRPTSNAASLQLTFTSGDESSKVVPF